MRMGNLGFRAAAGTILGVLLLVPTLGLAQSTTTNTDI